MKDAAPGAPRYAELAACTNFSFLRGASHPWEMVQQARQLGLAGLGISDRNTVAGVVQAHAAWRKGPASAGTMAPGPGLRLALGARLVFADGTPDILAYPRDRAGWGRLCRLLTQGNQRTTKGKCTLFAADLLGDARGLLCLVLPEPAPFAPFLAALREAAPDAVWLGARMARGGDDRRRLAGLAIAARRAGVKLLAVNDALYHAPERRPLHDVLACIRTGTTLTAAGRQLEANAERHLKPAAEMARLFRDLPEAVEESLRLLACAGFSLDDIGYQYPDEPVPPGTTAQAHLCALAQAGAAERYPAGVPPEVRATLAKELALIAELDYAPYFLTVHDIVRFARSKGILCQGRGSAANSAVCYVLGITAVDPAHSELLFERFLSRERQEPPDIDVDFEHERREEVIQYIYQRYGRARAGIAATVIHYRPRSAIREVGKVLGLSEDVTAAIAGTVWGSWGSGLSDPQARQAGLDPANPVIRRALDLAAGLMGFPRHLSQHVGGFVLTRDRLDETVPIGNAAMAERTFIEWDKNDLDEVGLMKVDVLGLGMLSCIRRAFDLIAGHGGPRYELASVPQEDPAVYAMLQRGDSLGVFQVESRAQMNMLPRLKPTCFYDLVIQVAIVRPGPIQGDMVHPYLRRRNKLEKEEYPAPAGGDPDELRNVLSRTLGVPLFQEQAMKIAMVAAAFTPEEANGLRRAMATFRHVGTIGEFEAKMVQRMVARGYEAGFAQRCFNQIKGFGEYGFPESHAASFAGLVYVSSWLKCHHPAAFACALLNSQPMGFYAPAQIVRDAREHGVDVREADVAQSFWDSHLENGTGGAPALRLGLRRIDSFREDWARRIVAARARLGPAGFGDVEQLLRATGLPHRALALLADADALRPLGLDRRAALWAVRRLPDDTPLPLFAAAQARELGAEPEVMLPALTAAEQVVADYQTLRLSLKGHPMQFLRAGLAAEGVSSCAGAGQRRDGARLTVAGVVLVRQRPGSSKGVVFVTLEDETGIANIVVWPKLAERFRRELMGARLMLVEGRVQKSPEGIVHVVAARLIDRTADLARLAANGAVQPPLARADEVLHPQSPRGPKRLPAGARAAGHPREVRVLPKRRLLPKSRDFH
ncbi:MAG TPA: error-prone DNA polymerase [Xanthobacteraceae bacterium]|nr:error-prone DNA polymerase [Xanthobacteraceae bacterium]